MLKSCIFCKLKNKKNEVLFEDEYCFILEDGNPVSKYHTLIIPKRHFADFFDATKEEYNSIISLLRKRREELLAKDETITGFNIGVNIGATSGQTVMHLHVHLIPRREGDTPNPRGGVRGVIPAKMSY
jgi:ATP adenylyltransferase